MYGFKIILKLALQWLGIQHGIGDLDARNSMWWLFQWGRRGSFLLSMCKLSYVPNTNILGPSFLFSGKLLVWENGTASYWGPYCPERGAWQGYHRPVITHWADCRSLRNKTQNGAYEWNLILNVKTLQTINISAPREAHWAKKKKEQLLCVLSQHSS